jgi:tetratricopeptide (TPR) repeat protein
LRTSRSKIADRKKTEKRKTERRKSQKRSIVRKKKSVVREKKVERRLAVKAASDLRSSQDKQNKINEETLKSLDREFDKEIDVPEIKETEKKPEQGKVVEEEAEVVVASLPNTPVKSSEETPQAKLSRLSKNISGLKNNLKNNGGNPGTLLAKLGEAYLEAQRFMDSQMDDEEKQHLLDLSKNGDLVLGSYEQAAWAYKLALNFNHRSAETHLKIGKIYDEMKDGQNALMYAKLAHQIFKRNHNSSQMKETQSFIDLLTTKYKNQSEKKWCTKDNISFIVGVTISTGSINIIDLEV